MLCPIRFVIKLRSPSQGNANFLCPFYLQINITTHHLPKLSFINQTGTHVGKQRDSASQLVLDNLFLRMSKKQKQVEQKPYWEEKDLKFTHSPRIPLYPHQKHHQTKEEKMSKCTKASTLGVPSSDSPQLTILHTAICSKSLHNAH